jgi:hypothetical protein
VFQRRVVGRHLQARQPISLVMAIPDHPWTKATRQAAAVRIAMTVGEAGVREGRLREVVREGRLDTDQPEIGLTERIGMINADLSVGLDVTTVAPSAFSRPGYMSPIRRPAALIPCRSRIPQSRCGLRSVHLPRSWTGIGNTAKPSIPR